MFLLLGGLQAAGPVVPSGRGTRQPLPASEAKKASTPPTRVMLEAAKKDRKQADYIQLKAFENNANKAYVLTRQIVEGSAVAMDAKAELKLRKKGGEVSSRITRMIRFLETGREQKLSETSRTSANLHESSSRLLEALEALRPEMKA